jgi:formylglycine-generating enzyme required for sulfatase activity
MQNLIFLIALCCFESLPVGSGNGSSTIQPEMVLVEGGTFNMGSADAKEKGKPAHAVTLSTFYIGKYEVTQSFWKEVMGNNPSNFKGCDACPVEQISGNEIETFLSKLNSLTGKHYRLPTEAEWEYAALGGNKSKGYKYSGSNNLDEVAWYLGNADNMSGNVWELCSDWFAGNYYNNGPTTNPRNDKKTFHKVVRGGSWRSAEDRCHSKSRFRDIRDHFGKGNGGFRLALDE